MKMGEMGAWKKSERETERGGESCSRTDSLSLETESRGLLRSWGMKVRGETSNVCGGITHGAGPLSPQPPTPPAPPPPSCHVASTREPSTHHTAFHRPAAPAMLF